MLNKNIILHIFQRPSHEYNGPNTPLLRTGNLYEKKCEFCDNRFQNELSLLM